MMKTVGRIFPSGPRWTYRRIWSDALLVTLLVTLALWAACSIAGITTKEFFDENGVHEMLQSAALALASAVGIAGALRSRGVARYASLSTGLLCFICFFREIPNCDRDLQVFCTVGETDHYSIALGILLLIAMTAITEWRRRGTLLQTLNPRISWPLGVAGLALVASQVFEALHLVAIEETLELYGYVILLFGTGWVCARPSSLEQQQETGRETL